MKATSRRNRQKIGSLRIRGKLDGYEELQRPEFRHRILPRRGDEGRWREIFREAQIMGIMPDASRRRTLPDPFAERLTNSNGQPRGWMVDMRVALTNAESAAWILDHLAWSLQGGDFVAQGLAGISYSGSLMIGALLQRLPGIEGCIVRMERKKYGRRRIIEGGRPKRVILMDDSMNGGGAMMRAKKNLDDEGIKVDGCLTIVRYGWGRGAHRLAQAGIKSAHIVQIDRPLP